MANGARTLPALEPFESAESKPAGRARWQIRAKLSSSWKKAGSRISPHVGRVVAYRLALPGVAGAGLISAGIALRFGIWAGLIVGGFFCLRIDSRLR